MNELALKKANNLAGRIEGRKEELDEITSAIENVTGDKMFNKGSKNKKDRWENESYARIDLPNSTPSIYIEDKNTMKVLLTLLREYKYAELTKLEKEFAELPAEISENKEVDLDA